AGGGRRGWGRGARSQGCRNALSYRETDDRICGRSAPHRPLPPCRGGTGWGGWQNVEIDGSAIPPPLAPPHKGREIRSHLRRGRQFSSAAPERPATNHPGTRELILRALPLRPDMREEVGEVLEVG